jgi:catechol 2,3-dioxygenase-like lactoylglutathione lyase family enzyme
MLLDLSHIGQIALAVRDVDRAEKFFRRIDGVSKALSPW